MRVFPLVALVALLYIYVENRSPSPAERMGLREHVGFRIGGEGEAGAGGGEGDEEGDAATVGEFVGRAGVGGAGCRRGCDCGRGTGCGGTRYGVGTGRGEGCCAGHSGDFGTRRGGGRSMRDGAAFAARWFHAAVRGRFPVRGWRRDEAGDLVEAEVADGLVSFDARRDDFAGDEDERGADGEREFLAAAEESPHAAADEREGAAAALGEAREDGAHAQAVDLAAAARCVDGDAAAVLVVDGQDGGDALVGREGGRRGCVGRRGGCAQVCCDRRGGAGGPDGCGGVGRPRGCERGRWRGVCVEAGRRGGWDGTLWRGGRAGAGWLDKRGSTL